MEPKQFSVLLVEDEVPLRNQWARALQTVPFLRVVEAGDVAAAERQIRHEEEQGRPFDAAILDFKLPRSPGEPDEPNFTLCEQLRANGHTQIWHISAYLDQPEVKEHVMAVHPPTEPRRVLKKTPGFTEELVTDLQQALPELRIEDGLKSLGSAEIRSGVGRPSRARPSGPSSTILLADVMSDIADYWRWLHPGFQDKLRASFEIVESPSGIDVSAL